MVEEIGKSHYTDQLIKYTHGFIDGKVVSDRVLKDRVCPVGGDFPWKSLVSEELQSLIDIGGQYCHETKTYTNEFSLDGWLMREVGLITRQEAEERISSRIDELRKRFNEAFLMMKFYGEE